MTSDLETKQDYSQRINKKKGKQASYKKQNEASDSARNTQSI